MGNVCRPRWMGGVSRVTDRVSLGMSPSKSMEVEISTPFSL